MTRAVKIIDLRPKKCRIIMTKAEALYLILMFSAVAVAAVIWATI